MRSLGPEARAPLRPLYVALPLLQTLHDSHQHTDVIETSNSQSQQALSLCRAADHWALTPDNSLKRIHNLCPLLALTAVMLQAKYWRLSIILNQAQPLRMCLLHSNSLLGST